MDILVSYYIKSGKNEQCKKISNCLNNSRNQMNQNKAVNISELSYAY